MYVARWRAGAPAAFDFAVTSGLRSELVWHSARDGQSVLLRYEDAKCSHMDTKAHCAAEGITFVPMVVDAVGGGWGPEAQRVWGELAKSQALAAGESSSTTGPRLLQSLAIVLHRENARAVLRRSPRPSDPTSLRRAAATLAGAAAEQQS